MASSPTTSSSTYAARLTNGRSSLTPSVRQSDGATGVDGLRAAGIACCCSPHDVRTVVVVVVVVMLVVVVVVVVVAVARDERGAAEHRTARLLRRERAADDSSLAQHPQHRAAPDAAAG